MNLISLQNNHGGRLCRYKPLDKITSEMNNSRKTHKSLYNCNLVVVI